MSLPGEQRIGRWPELPAGLFRADPWVRGSWIGLAVGALLSFLQPWIDWGTLLALMTAVLVWIAAGQCLERSGHGTERRFWYWVRWAQGFWIARLVLDLPWLVSVLGEWAPRRFGLVDLLLGAFYFLLILATEHRPDVRRSAAATRLDMLWVQPAALLFVLASVLYFPAVGRYAGASPDQVEVLNLWLGALLAGWVTLRLAWFAYEALSLRWRWQYVVMALAVVTVGAVDLARAWNENPAPAPWAWALGSSWWIVAAAFNRLAYDGSKSRKQRAGFHLDLSAAHRSTTLVWALVLLFVQILLHRAGRLPVDGRELREGVVLGALALLGGYAVVQRYRVELETVDAWFDHRAMAEQLRSNEDDLRVLVERNRGVRELEESERKFALAFSLCPVGMCITTLDHGLVVDANEAFCRLFEVEPAQVVGRLTQDLGFWSNFDLRHEVVDLVLSRGGLRNRSWWRENAAGDKRRLEGSFELIHSGEDTLMLSMVRDVTDRDLDPDRDLELLSPTGIAVLAVDAEQRILFWSRGAEALFGWDRNEVSGRDLPSLGLEELCRPSESPHRKSMLRRRVSTREGLPLRLICRLTDLVGDPPSDGGRLILATLSRGGSRLRRAETRRFR